MALQEGKKKTERIKVSANATKKKSALSDNKKKAAKDVVKKKLCS